MSLQFLQPYFGLGNGLQTKNAGGGGVGGWVELGRTTLGSTQTSVDVTGLANKRYYMVLGSLSHNGSIDVTARLGNGTFDSGTNYADRRSENGGADAATTSRGNMIIADIASSTETFNVGYISNFSTKEKLMMTQHVNQSTAGAGTAPQRTESVGKWANTSNSLDRFQYDSGSWLSGSECVVLGWDPADTHSNNFWTELASVDGSGSSFDVTFTPKKYLWIQFYGTLSSGTGGLALRTGSGSVDTGTNYARRISKNGAGDSTQVSDDNINPAYPDAPTSFFVNIFVINVSAKEKLFICNTVDQSTAGAGTAPNRYENVSKWTNTSGQIDRFRFLTAGGGTWGSNTIAKIWGAD